VAAVLSGLDVVIAVNEDVDRGMLSSVQAGMRMADTNVHGYFICLGDQPEVSACVIERILESAHGRAGIIIPTTDGKRGHPIFIHRRYAEQILRLDSATTGLNSVTRSNEHDTLEIPVEDSLILLDMDTPADYERVLQHAKGNV
jgi:molybdenum cofactor cytidylyltransferase